MASRNNNKKPVNEQLWVRILAGALGILMALGTFVYVFASFEARAENQTVQDEQEITVGIAYGNETLPTYTVCGENGFDISVSSDKNKSFYFPSKEISVVANANVYKTHEGYESDPNRVTVIGGYHVQISSYSFRIGADGMGDNPAPIFPGGSIGGSIDDLGYTYDEVISKISDLNDSGILEYSNSYSYPVFSGGKYSIRVGNFDTFEKAQEFNQVLSESLSMVSEITEPGDGSISLIDHTENKVLVSYFLTENDSLTLSPNTYNYFADCNQLEYYGYAKFEFINDKFSVSNCLKLEDYVKSVLPLTVSSTENIEILKMFSVILRTKVIYNSEFHEKHGIDVCIDSHCCIYYGRSFENELTTQAVELTKGEIITYDNAPISPVYCLSTGSTTALSLDVFGKDVPYLKTHSNADRNAPEWTYSMSPGDVLDLLLNAGYTEISANISSIEILSYGEGSHYVNSLRFRDILGNELTVNGSDAIYKALGCKLPSVAFTVGQAGETVEKLTYNDGQPIKQSILLDGLFGKFVFVGSGEGNGLGVSILGAKDDASNGMTYSQIITKYYHGVMITKL